MEQQQLQPDPPNYQQPPNYDEDINIQNIVHMLQLITSMIETIVQHLMQLQ